MVFDVPFVDVGLAKSLLMLAGRARHYDGDFGKDLVPKRAQNK